MEANQFIRANGLGKALDRCRRALCGIAFFVSALFVALGGVAEARVAANSDAAQFVAQVGKEVINVLGAPNQAVDQRYRKFQSIFDRALDPDVMARHGACLGAIGEPRLKRKKRGMSGFSVDMFWEYMRSSSAYTRVRNSPYCGKNVRMPRRP